MLCYIFEAWTRAYHEGVDVLFSTNTFHIDRPALAACLSSFISSANLARLRALELKLDWRQARIDRDFEAYDQRLEEILRNLPGQLPNLRRLSIALQDNLYPDPDA